MGAAAGHATCNNAPSTATCLTISPPCSPRSCRSPWPPLGALRGKIMPVLILHGGSAEAAAFQEAFPDLGALVECDCI